MANTGVVPFFRVNVQIRWVNVLTIDRAIETQ